jgi:hypothetical protein
VVDCVPLVNRLRTAGVTLRESFRRARWTKGEAYVWLGVQKQTGRGERSSGQAFDTIINSPPKSSWVIARHLVSSETAVGVRYYPDPGP